MQDPHHLGSCRSLSQVASGTRFSPASLVLLMQVQWVAPYAAGAGGSLVMAYLNGNAVPGLLTARTLSVKIVGTTLGVASNLVLGPEAPLIHIGACVAHVTCQVACGKDAGLLVACACCPEAGSAKGRVTVCLLLLGRARSMRGIPYSLCWQLRVLGVDMLKGQTPQLEPVVPSLQRWVRGAKRGVTSSCDVAPAHRTSANRIVRETGYPLRPAVRPCSRGSAPSTLAFCTLMQARHCAHFLGLLAASTWWEWLARLASRLPIA